MIKSLQYWLNFEFEILECYCGLLLKFSEGNEIIETYH